MKRIVIFASGTGSNACRIIEYFQNKDVEVALVLSNKPDAPVLKKADSLNVNTISFNRKIFYQTPYIANLLKDVNPNLIVLAGFLWLFPDNILHDFPEKVINLHPSLLPDFGGKGMYGDYVHQAVINASKKESGITIHYVTPEYDKGNILFQSSVPVDDTETAESLATKIHKLEHKHLPQVIEKLLSTLDNG